MNPDDVFRTFNFFLVADIDVCNSFDIVTYLMPQKCKPAHMR